MSVTVMAWVFAHSDTALANRLVLLALADEADDDGGSCFPSQRRLAVKARVSLTTARRAIAALEEAGELVVDRPEVTGRGRFNRYVLVMGRDVAEAQTLLDHEKGAQSGPLPRGEKRARTRQNAPPIAGANSLTLEPERTDSRVEPSATVVGDGGQTPAQRAQALTATWWESCDPRPMVPFLGARKIVEKALKAGWSEEQITRALPHAQPLSGWRLESVLQRHRQADDARAERDVHPDDPTPADPGWEAAVKGTAG